MSDLLIALAEDAADRPLNAEAAYKRAIQSASANLEAYLNLAVLYLQFADFGYASYHGIPEDLVNRSYELAMETLDQAQARFGPHPEIDVWRAYADFAVRGSSLDLEALLQLARQRQTLAPYLLLASVSGLKQYRTQAQALLEQIKDGKTERHRLMRSILESALGKRSGNKS